MSEDLITSILIGLCAVGLIVAYFELKKGNHIKTKIMTELTNGGKKILVNEKNILYVESYNERKSFIMLIGGNNLTVDQSVEDIKKLLIKIGNNEECP